MIVFQTKKAVNHLDFEKMIQGGTRKGVVRMVMGGHGLTRNPNEKGVYQDVIEVKYQLLDEEGRMIHTPDGGVFRLVLDEVKAFSKSINKNISDDDNIVDRFKEEAKFFAVKKFAEAFGLKALDIEEIG